MSCGELLKVYVLKVTCNWEVMCFLFKQPTFDIVGHVMSMQQTSFIQGGTELTVSTVKEQHSPRHLLFFANY